MASGEGTSAYEKYAQFKLLAERTWGPDWKKLVLSFPHAVIRFADAWMEFGLPYDPDEPPPRSRDGYGLWQIVPGGYDFKSADLSPGAQTAAALRLWRRQGGSWTAWPGDNCEGMGV